MWFRALLTAGFTVTLSGARAAEETAPYGLSDAKVFAGPNEAEARTIDEGYISPAASTAEFTKAFARVAGEIARAKALTVFEGHPRMRDATAAVAEQAKKPSFSRLGQWFYATPLPVPEDVARKLRRAVLNGTQFWRGLKLCGGFHADFLLRWEGPAGTTEALLCFGCHEVKIVGASGAVYGDLADEQVTEIRAVLKEFLGGEPAAGRP